MLWLCIYAIVSKQSMLLSSKLKDMIKIYYFSDSATSQYKIKKMSLTPAVIYGFVMAAECHFLTTSHGRGEYHDMEGKNYNSNKKDKPTNPF